MTNKIYITYDRNETVTFSFWKQFFLMSGVWVIGNKIEDTGKKDDQEKIDSGYLHLYLLSKSNLSVIKENIVKDNVFYFMNLRHYNGNNLYQCRKDILTYDWKKQYTFINALEKITCEKYRKLIKIYINNSLWLSIWLYFEVAYEKKTEWDDWILKNVKDAIRSLAKFEEKNTEAENLWNYKFMHLYCDYLETAIESRDVEERTEKVRVLLQKVMSLSMERGWQPALCDLCAAISDLSPLENKKAVVYYKELLEYEESPEILYKIGKIYEKKYGDIEMAMRYYKLANINNKYYRAKYKIASYYEKKGDWKHALFLYENIMERIRNELKDNSYHSTTVYDVEYYEKSLIKIRNIFSQKILYDGHELDGLIKNIRNDISEISCLAKIIHCMRMMANRNAIIAGIDKDNGKKSEKKKENEFLKDIMGYIQERIDIYF